MFAVDKLILISGILLLLGIASSRFSARLGVPVLVMFLALGMLAGSQGIGGIEFDNYVLAHGIGTLSLAVILFDGGLSTELSSVRAAWKPSLVLATFGVVLTAGITGAAAAWILDLSWLEGMLLGSIVGSTDAAAVFAVLRSGGVNLPKRLTATLEIESASNDPMAIFLTVGCIELLMGRVTFGPELLSMFVIQMAVGGIVGLGMGFVTVWLVNRIQMDSAGLYPVLVSACALLAFGIAAALGGSGFLAVYLAGIVIGNSRMVFQRGIFLFHDAGAWLGQIVMFVVLGLLSFPRKLPEIAGNGLLIAAVLTLVARPVSVWVTMIFFRYNWRELTFLSWVGLKGAVPITLATFPLMMNVPGASVIFDVVFFVVVVSALIQGATLPVVARWLKLQIPPEPNPPITLEISSLRHVDGDIVDFTITPDSQVAGRMVKQLALPEGVVIALVARQQSLIPPQGSTRIEAGDHVILVMRPEARPLVNKIFRRKGAESERLPLSMEFPLRGSTTVKELQELYDIPMEAPADATLDQVLRYRLGGVPAIQNEAVTFGQIALFVREVSDGGTIERVGMVILPQREPPQSEPPQPEPPQPEPQVASAPSPLPPQE